EQWKLKFFTLRGYAQELKEAQIAPYFRLVLLVEQERRLVRAVMPRQVETGARPCAQQHGEGVARDAAAVHLNRQVEAAAVNTGEEAGQLAHVQGLLREAWEARR